MRVLKDFAAILAILAGVDVIALLASRAMHSTRQKAASHDEDDYR